MRESRHHKQTFIFTCYFSFGWWLCKAKYSIPQKTKDTEETRQFRRQHIVLKCRYIKLPGNPDSPFSYEKQITLLIRNKSCETSSILTFPIPTIQH